MSAIKFNLRLILVSVLTTIWTIETNTAVGTLSA
jgi:hypothetical protein